ncbi:MAG TPA: hypothetical protein VIN66_01270 [Rheinheimera sp.]|uniref:hypothetical protein n=1 Tax=Rheinheimera sp. TaxID=1869214 RepID=UPI002F943384
MTKHPMIYLLGDTEQHSYPLILTIGREPNQDLELDNSIGHLNTAEFSKQRGGVFVTAYTQIAKQFIGDNTLISQFKGYCLENNASPILFANAYPKAIKNDVVNKVQLRAQLTAEEIRQHISNLFNCALAKRYALVIQHGVDNSTASQIAQQTVKQYCHELGIDYITSAYFYNGNSEKIQRDLSSVKSNINAIVAEFTKKR